MGVAVVLVVVTVIVVVVVCACEGEGGCTRRAGRGVSVAERACWFSKLKLKTW